MAIYCVAFGNDVNTNSLKLTWQTGGHYYLAATTADLGAQFQNIQKDIGGQYVAALGNLEAATSRRTRPGFQPSFQISYDGYTATWIPNIVYDEHHED